MHREQGAPSAQTLDEQIAALEAQLEPEPTQAELDAREKEEKLAAVKRKLRAQEIERALASAKRTANGRYRVEAIDFDERMELDPSIMTWVVVRGTTAAEQKEFEEARESGRQDTKSGRILLIALVKKCVVAPSLSTPEMVLAFEHAFNNIFGMGLNTIADKALRLGGMRRAEENAFR